MITHVCHLCSRQHKRGAKTFDRARNRCAANCTRRPVTARPFAWVGKTTCSTCGAVIPKGTTKCKNRDVCIGRSLNGLKKLTYDNTTIEKWYEEAKAA